MDPEHTLHHSSYNATKPYFSKHQQTIGYFSFREQLQAGGAGRDSAERFLTFFFAFKGVFHTS